MRREIVCRVTPQSAAAWSTVSVSAIAGSVRRQGKSLLPRTGAPAPCRVSQQKDGAAHRTELLPRYGAEPRSRRTATERLLRALPRRRSIAPLTGRSCSPATELSQESARDGWHRHGAAAPGVAQATEHRAAH